MGLTFLLLLHLASFNVIMASSSENEVHVSPIYQIDENVGKDGTAPFYIQIQVDDQCPVYICYLSQLDENYVPSDKSHQIRAGFTLRNLEKSEITKQCNPENHGKRINIKDIIQPKAWHGLKVEMVDEKKDVVHIQTSFSVEKIYLKLANADESAIQIHFGTPDKPLSTQYIDSMGTVFFAFSENQKMDILPRVPPNTTLDSVTNIRDAFQGNPGSWLIQMDMAQMENFDGTGPTRMVFFVADCIKDNLPKVKLVKPNGMEVWIFDTDVEKRTSPEVGKNTEDTDITASPKMSPMTLSTTSSAIPLETTTETSTETTTTEEKPVCKTVYVNAKAALIRDRFHDLKSACPTPKKPKTCKEHVDYAVRVGCIDCKPGITQAEQNVFLETLRAWLNEKVENAAEGEYLDDELEGWKGTQLGVFFNSRNEQQTIEKIEPGGFRYVTVPREWVEKGLHMLVQDCGKYGIFASAFHEGKVDNSPLESAFNWEKKFEFLENCVFDVNNVVDENYKAINGQKYERRSMLYGRKIQFGTYKMDAKKKEKENYTLSAEDIQAHKRIKPKPELVLQTTTYQLDALYYDLKNDPGQKCVFEPSCLDDVDIFKYGKKLGGK